MALKNQLYIAVICLVAMHTGPQKASAQYYNLAFRNYTSSTGLSQSEVESVFEDREGFLWIGSHYGLTRYDGKEFKTYYHQVNDPASIGENMILDISQDRKGYLWFAVYNSGISRLNPLNKKFENFRPETGRNSIISDKVLSICIDSSDRVWAGTREGLSIYDPAAGRFSNYPALPGEPKGSSILCMEGDRQGNIWLGTASHLYITSGDPSAIRRIRCANPINHVNSLQFDDVNMGWMATDEGLFMFNILPGDSIILRRPDFFSSREEIEDIEFDMKENLWIATRKNGLLIYFSKTGFIDKLKEDYSSSRGLLSNRLFDLYHDYRGGMWVSGENGLQSFHDAAQRFNIYPGLNNISDRVRGSSIYGLFEEGDIILLATSGGVIAYNRLNNSYLPVSVDPEIKNIPIRFRYIHKEAPGKWWLTSDFGCFELIRERQGFVLRRSAELSHPVFHEYSIRNFIHDGNITWFSTTDSGVIRYDRSARTVERFQHQDGNPSSLQENRVNMITFSTDGDLLVGHDFGFSMLRKGSKQFENHTFGTPSGRGLSNRYVYDLFDDGKEIWIATYGGGMNVFNKSTGSIISLTTRDGLCSDAVYTIMPESDSLLWLGTNKGLSRLHTRSGHFENYEMNDGMPADEFNMLSKYRSSSGEIFMGTMNGVISFYPGTLSENKLPPKVYLSWIRKNGIIQNDSITTVVNRDRRLYTRYGEDVFLEFSPLTFYGNSQSILHYKIRELGNQWKNGESGGLLPLVKTAPGDYTIDIQMQNESGLGRSPVWTLTFSVLPPFWMTLGFRLTATALLMVIGFFSIRTYIRRRLERQRAAFLKQQAVEQERSRISAELHDDIGGGLTAIRLISEMNLEKNPDPSARKYLEKISFSSNELIQKMNEIVWALNVNNDNLQSLIAYTRQYTVSYLDDMNIDYQIDIPESIPELTVTGNKRRSIFLLVKESLSNIAKHAGASLVRIRISMDNKLRLEIADNGRGISTNPANAYGNGMRNMRKRIQDMKGDMQVYNQNGTSLVFEIPLKSLNS